jgi:hypothetical protein
LTSSPLEQAYSQHVSATRPKGTSISSSPTTTHPATGSSLDPAEICSLPPRDLQERLEWIRREILPHAVGSQRTGSGRAIELEAAAGLEWKLERLIEAERECCSGIDFEQVASAIPGRLRLEIRGVDPDAAIFSTLAGVRPSRGPRSPAARFAKAAGIGALGSVFLCCVLPLGAGALVGSTALSFLDAPLPIGIGALLGGGAAWWWLGRQGDRTSAVPGSCDSGC